MVRWEAKRREQATSSSDGMLNRRRNEQIGDSWVFFGLSATVHLMAKILGRQA